LIDFQPNAVWSFCQPLTLQTASEHVHQGGRRLTIRLNLLLLPIHTQVIHRHGPQPQGIFSREWDRQSSNGIIVHDPRA